MQSIRVKSTAYPFDYDKNGSRDRNTTRFAKGFNKWSDHLREQVNDYSGVGQTQLSEAKKLIAVTVNK